MSRLKGTQLYYSLSILLVLFTITKPVYSQVYDIKDSWNFGLKIGLASFFGDLSVHDFNPVRKLTDESDFSIGFQIGKSLSSLVDLRITYHLGNMKGANPEMDMYFSNKFNEISVESAVSLSRILWPESVSGFNLTLNAGLGLIQYRSIKYRLSDNSYLSSEGYNPQEEPEGEASLSMVFPVGAGLNYTINPQWIITSDFAFRLHNKDLLDSQIGETDIDDRYSIASIGIIYVVNPVKIRSRRSMKCPDDF
ncbi:MAG: hypothetical protein HGA37_12135 [Lentimicrobium sp.]|nr:hypothetical protein [Lentimicrobium sp.]